MGPLAGCCWVSSSPTRPAGHSWPSVSEGCFFGVSKFLESDAERHSNKHVYHARKQRRAPECLAAFRERGCQTGWCERKGADSPITISHQAWRNFAVRTI